MNKKYCTLENLPERFSLSFGQLATPFIGIIWGPSGNGKTNLVMQIIETLTGYGKVLYLSLEEGHEATIRNTLIRHFEGKTQASRNISIADHTMNYAALCERLRRKRSPAFIVVDSLQYWAITTKQYKALKEEFRSKSFIYISHARGKSPEGNTGFRIRYDAGIKVRVEGYLAFPASRYGGNMPYVIWEEGAKRYWGKAYRKHTAHLKSVKA